MNRNVYKPLFPSPFPIASEKAFKVPFAYFIITIVVYHFILNSSDFQRFRRFYHFYDGFPYISIYILILSSIILPLYSILSFYSHF